MRAEQRLDGYVELPGELHGQGVDRSVEIQCVRHFFFPFSGRVGQSASRVSSRR